MQVWHINSPIARKSAHPEEGDKVVHCPTDTFTILEGNGIVLSSDGHTMAAVFSGSFCLPAEAATALKKVMQEWQEDIQARVPHKGPRKRSYDDGTFVSKLFPTNNMKACINCFLSFLQQEAGLHYGIAVPAAGNTSLGHECVPQKVLELKNFVKSEGLKLGKQ